MLGWFSADAACASRWNRDRAPGSRARSGGRNFRATKRRKRSVFCLVHHAHATAPELFDNAVVRDGLVDHHALSGALLRVTSYQCRISESIKNAIVGGPARPWSHLRNSTSKARSWLSQLPIACDSSGLRCIHGDLLGKPIMSADMPLNPGTKWIPVPRADHNRRAIGSGMGIRIRMGYFRASGSLALLCCRTYTPKVCPKRFFLL